MELLFLGTGTSTGVPQIGCNCDVCTSTNPKDKRLRASILITKEKARILIDAGPDLRQQLLSNNINQLSGILLTHEHYDHIGGLDDLRPLGNSDIYAEDRVLKTIQLTMPYCFREKKYPGVPLINLHEINETIFKVNDIDIQPIRVMHEKLPILGFRIENLAYLTDVKTLDGKSFELLKNLDVLVINALRKNYHFSHLSLEEAFNMAEKIGAKKTFFTHMSHDMGLHESINNILPKHIQLTYDGLKINL
jgi:phosphoribosyl 1,2-cyclic phosphate phosphodiesterase